MSSGSKKRPRAKQPAKRVVVTKHRGSPELAAWQDGVLDAVARSTVGQLVVFGGGAALACRHLHHRTSEDLDFFLRLRAPLRFVRNLRAVHRRDGSDRADAFARGQAKGTFLVWLARHHGGQNPWTLLHLLLALFAAASGRGQEPASWRGVIAGLRV